MNKIKIDTSKKPFIRWFVKYWLGYSETDICDILKSFIAFSCCFIAVLFIVVFFILFIVANITLIGFDYLPPTLEEVFQGGWILLIFSSITSASMILIGFLIGLIEFMPDKWKPARFKQGEKDTTPSLLSVWWKNFKDKTCVMVEFLDGDDK